MNVCARGCFLALAERKGTPKLVCAADGPYVKKPHSLFTEEPSNQDLSGAPTAKALLGQASSSLSKAIASRRHHYLSWRFVSQANSVLGERDISFLSLFLKPATNLLDWGPSSSFRRQGEKSFSRLFFI